MPVMQKLREVELGFSLRWPQLAALRPAHVLAWALGMSAAAALLPFALPCTTSHTINSTAVMLATFVACGAIASRWVVAQYRERRDLPRWCSMTFAWSPLVAALILGVLFAPVYLVGAVCDHRNGEALKREEAVRDFELMKGPDNPHMSGTPTWQIDSVSLAKRLCTVDRVLRVRAASSASPMPAEDPFAKYMTGPDVERASSLTNCEPLGRPNDDSAKSVALRQTYFAAGQNFIAVARAHNLDIGWSPSSEPNWRAVLSCLITLIACLSSLGGVVRARLVASVSMTIVGATVAVQELRAVVKAAVSGESLHGMAVTWEISAWLAYGSLLTFAVLTLLRKPTRGPTMDFALIPVVLGPLVILAVHRSLSPDDFVKYSFRTLPRSTIFAGHSFVYSVLGFTLVLQSGVFELLRRYRAAPSKH